MQPPLAEAHECHKCRAQIPANKFSEHIRKCKISRIEEEPDICEGCGLAGQTPMHKSICRGHGEHFDETKLT
jgi:sulfopyruvate decarboxylase TPP-binding subunit